MRDETIAVIVIWILAMFAGGFFGAAVALDEGLWELLFLFIAVLAYSVARAMFELWMADFSEES